MLDDKITKNILGDLKKHMPPGGFPKHKPLLVPSGGASQAKAKPAPHGDLLVTMSQRLAQLEGLNKSLRCEHQEKVARLEKLEKENAVLTLAASVEGQDALKTDKMEVERMRKQINDMKKFLADYGLVWIGRDGKAKPTEEELKTAVKASHAQKERPAMASRALPKEIDTEVLTKRIEELNFIAEKQHVVKNKDGLHHFKKVDEVLIFFFKNGLIIKGCPFYAYSSKEA